MTRRLLGFLALLLGLGASGCVAPDQGIYLEKRLDSVETTLKDQRLAMEQARQAVAMGADPSKAAQLRDDAILAALKRGEGRQDQVSQERREDPVGGLPPWAQILMMAGSVLGITTPWGGHRLIAKLLGLPGFIAKELSDAPPTPGPGPAGDGLIPVPRA